MKKTTLHLFVLWIVIGLLSACSSSGDESASISVPKNTAVLVEGPEQNVEQAPESASSISPQMQEYLDEVDLIMADIANAGSELDELFFLAADNMEYLDNENWVMLANTALERMERGADKLDALTPVPAQAEQAHEYFKLAAEELRMVVLYQHEVIQGNFDSVYSVTDHMQAHLNYAQQAFDEIDKIINP